MNNWILKGVKKPYPIGQCPPWRVCVCLLGQVCTMGTFTLRLDCKTVGQNHFCKALIARRDIFAQSALASLQSHSLFSSSLFNFPLTARARVLDLGHPGHFLERSEKASKLKLNFRVNLRGLFLKNPSLISTKTFICKVKTQSGFISLSRG